jgi:CBS domain-containing protein
LSERLRVDDALEPVTRSVGPDMPLSQVVDLLIRERVGAVTVVGERSEILGIITSGDALSQMLRGSPTRDEAAPDEGELTARDIMTRTVLCVSEGQPLMEAAHMMVNKKVEQLPVVREGALVGIVTRGRVLRELFGNK